MKSLGIEVLIRIGCLILTISNVKPPYRVSFLSGNLISCSSKKQSMVFKNSTEREYLSIAHTVKELIWTRLLLTELHISLRAPNYLGGQSRLHRFVLKCSSLCAKETCNLYFLKEQVLYGKPSVCHVPMLDQTSDILTI